MTKSITERYVVKPTMTTITFPGTDLAIAHPFFGPATMQQLSNQIRAKDLREPTSPEVMLVVHRMYGGRDTYGKEVTQTMRDRYFREFTAIVTGNKEIFFVDRPEYDTDGRIDRSKLIQRIAAGEKGIRTATRDSITQGVINQRDIEKSPYFIARYGQEGAAQAAELAARHPAQQAYVWLPQAEEHDLVISAAALDSVYNGGRLSVGGYGGDLDRDGVAFGVFGTGEAGKR